MTPDQIVSAWADAALEDKPTPLDEWVQACDLIADYLKIPFGKLPKAPADVCKSMELPKGSTWMEAMAFIADEGIDWTEHPGADTYLQQVRAAQAADNAKRSSKGGAA